MKNFLIAISKWHVSSLEMFQSSLIHVVFKHFLFASLELEIASIGLPRAGGSITRSAAKLPGPCYTEL